MSEEYIDQQTDNEFIENDGTVPVRKNMEVTMETIKDYAMDDEDWRTYEDSMAKMLVDLLEENVSIDELRNQFYLYLKYKEE